MYDKENFKNYVGGNSGASYVAGLKKIEEECSVSIDEEYYKDKCKNLIYIVESKKQDGGISSLERKYWSDRCSHLRKYVEFKDLMDNSNKEAFSQWIAKQPQKRNVSLKYSPLSCSAFVRALEKGLVFSAGFDYKTANFFFVNDVMEVNYRREKYKTFIRQYDINNRNSDFKNAIEFYSKFLNEKNGNNIIEEENTSLKLKISDLIESYKLNFNKIDEEERYKWIAIKHYKDNWDIDAPDFANMVEKAFAKTANLLAAGQYYPLRMVKEISSKHPEEVRKLFKRLYDESLPLANRFDDFRAGFDVFVKERKLNHYQDLHAISVYLTFEYPEKYYIYKYGVWTAFLRNIDEPIPSTKGKHETFKIENSNKICDEILSLVCEDIELCSMSASRLDNNCYDDPEYRMLAFDIMFYGSNYKSDESDGWWPSLEEYDPNLSKDDWKKYILEVEKPNHPSPMRMLKAMIELGGIASCKQLSLCFGGTVSYYVGCTTNLGRRVKKYFDLPVCMDGNLERYFPFPFQGKALDNEEGHQYLYRVRPELREALSEIDLSDISPYCDEKEHIAIINVDVDTITKAVLKEDMMKTDVEKNIILYGPPGTGKTYVTARYAVAIVENIPLAEIDKLAYEDVLERYNEYKSLGLIEFTTFHQSYGYEEFIEGIKPAVNADGDIEYRVEDGLFKKFCKEATSAIDKQNYVFIIDEINRGNISKIFGELITLIEPTKRVGQKEGMKVKLPYSQSTFGVPDNVYIIGTMNTADRSIAAIDTALRRRFAFKEMMPDTDVINEVDIEGVNVADLLDIINKRIEVLYDREHTIGHAYFTSLIDNPSKELLFDIFRNKIFPLLQEYFFEDYEKIQLVLGDNQKTDDGLKFIKENKVDYKNLFGSYSFDYDDKKTYEINDSAFMNIEAYKAMLQGNK